MKGVVRLVWFWYVGRAEARQALGPYAAGSDVVGGWGSGR